MKITFPDAGVRFGTATLHAEGTVHDVRESDAIVDAAIDEAFSDPTVQTIYGSWQDGPHIEVWLRQVGRAVHSHPLVASAFAEWQDDVLVWHWGRAQTPLTRKAPWLPFMSLAQWRDAVARHAAAVVAQQDAERTSEHQGKTPIVAPSRVR